MGATRGANQVEFLRKIVAAGGEIRQAHFVFPRGLAAGTRLYQLTMGQKGAMTLQELAWTPELEEYLLIEHPTRMSSPEEETERLANVLLNNLKSAETAFGEGFAQAVLVQMLSEKREYDLVKWLDRAPVTELSTGGDSYARCRQFLESAITGLQNTLVVALGYPNGPPTVKLMADALAIALDERFYITQRDKLFPRGHQ
jgi:hypothetical protein